MLTYAEIDLKALEKNYKVIKERISEKTKICAIIKADAYGHGSVRCAKVAIENGCSMFAVARMYEAIKLRKARIKTPIMLFGYADPVDLKLYHKYNITISTANYEHAKKINSMTKKKLPVHIKVDTGMGRNGVLHTEALEEILKINNLKNLKIEGLYTHLSCADEEDREYTLMQIYRFKELISKLENANINIPIKHCCNSAGLLNYPEAHFDMVRPGIIQYGLMPSKMFTRESTGITPIMSLYSTITEIKNVPAGFSISYGASYVTEKPMKIAIIPIGYADGYFRQLSNIGYICYNGKKCKILGNICMDLTVIDISEIEDAKVGDKVEVFGINLPAEEIAELANTTNYDITCKILPRAKRVYKK